MVERRRRHAHIQAGAPGWMVTYGDMMGLLLAFFVFFFAFATMSGEDVRAAMASLRRSLHMAPADAGSGGFTNSGRGSAPRDLDRLARELQRRMQVLGVDNEINIEADSRKAGIRIDIPNRLLFEPGGSTLRTDAYRILGEMAEALRGAPNPLVEVRGHTDNRALRSGTPFADNWDLCYHRAKAVMDHIQDVGELTDARFEAVACGPSQPVATNETEEGRETNRRTELVVRGEFTHEMEADVQHRIEAAAPGAGTRVNPGASAQTVR